MDETLAKVSPIRGHLRKNVVTMLPKLQYMNNSMRKRRSVKWFCILFVPAAWILLLAISVRPSSRESVREELIRRQAQTGLTLAWVDNDALGKCILTHTTLRSGVRAIMFKKRTIVPLNASLEVFRPDGFSFGEYPEVPGLGTCWSHDRTKLVDTMIERPSGRATWGILDLGSKPTHAIAINVDQKEYVTSECWSPDGKRLVYRMDGGVRLYELDNDRSDAIAKGTDPTWSPDGNWIAFRDREIYYAMHADGSR